MQATRTLQQRALNQLIKNASSKNGSLVLKAASSASMSTKPSTSRSVSTQAINFDEGLELLNKQRSLRPSSPHFTIYEPQLSWISSIANRITGTGLSVGIYAFAIAYAAAPAIGLPFDGAAVISFVASWPVWLKLSAKTILGAPFWYHTWNGMRHLSWDMGYLMSLRASWLAGYTVIGVTALSTLATTFLI